MTHDPALDGLRALAVIAVIAYHSEFRGTPAGFLGVDLFFVLSGYLITTLLIIEHTATGRIDLVNFWIRRARRLLPALILMVATLVAVSLALPDLFALD
ncbi:MAG: acyltransferase family protein, partial [Ilumatobacteraceae bacterium]